MSAESGESWLGLSTMVQPAASAGPTLHVTWFIGQFHGASSAQTPMGSRRMRVVPQSCSNSYVLSAAMASLRCRAPAVACPPIARPLGMPTSVVMASAICGMRFLYASRTAVSSSRRSSRVVCDQLSKARCAACTAASTSSGEAAAMRATSSSVAGLTTAISLPGCSGSTHRPSM